MINRHAFIVKDIDEESQAIKMLMQELVSVSHVCDMGRVQIKISI